MSILALIGLGSNRGDRKFYLDFAVDALSNTPGVTVRKVSGYRETPPIGGPEHQGNFLNAAAALETTLEPEALLDRLNEIEADAGRTRIVRWGERTLDLDLLLFGDRVIEAERLRVPHPRMALRRFVLAPAAEIAPEAVDPITGLTVLDLLANLDRRPSYLTFARPPIQSYATRRRIMDSFSRDDIAKLLEPARLVTVIPSDPTHLLARFRKSFQDWGITEKLIMRLPAQLIRANFEGDDLTLALDLFAEGLLVDSPDIPEGWLASAAKSSRSSVEPLEASTRNRWLISEIWMDGAFLDFDSLQTRTPYSQDFLKAYLAVRSTCIQPTFVIAHRKDRARLALHDPEHSWTRPVGWDTPVLEVPDYESDETLREILITCAATRAG